MSKTDEVRLRHMLDAARKAIAFTQNRIRTDLDNDEIFGMGLLSGTLAKISSKRV